MDFILFLFFSSLEYAAILLFLLTVFRMSLIGSTHLIVLISLSLSIVSFVLRFSIDIAVFSVLIQMLILVLLFKYFWRIQLFYAFVSVVVSYSAYLTIQAIVFVAMNALGLFNVEQLYKEIVDGVTILGYLLQLISVVISYLLSLLIKYKNLGWTFIPDAYVKVNLKNPMNQTLLTVSIISVLSFGSMVYVGIVGNEVFNISFSLILLVVQFLLIYISNKRENMND